MDAEAGLPQLIEAHVTRALDTEHLTVVDLLAGALAEVLHAIGSEQTDQLRTVAVSAAMAAAPASLDRLTAAVVGRYSEKRDEIGDRVLDVSNVAILAAAVVDLVLEDCGDPYGYIDAFISRALGGKERIGEAFEDASYSPAHSSSIIYLESFTWKGAVWAYGYGAPDAMQDYELWFLHRDGDDEGRRRALVRLTSIFAGAGLENHDDPEVRSCAREESWLQAERFNWYEPLDEWEVWGYEPTEELIDKHGLLIADRLGRRVSEVETVIRSLEKNDDQATGGAGGDYGEGLPVLEQDVRKELWWILNDTNRR